MTEGQDTFFSGPEEGTIHPDWNNNIVLLTADDKQIIPAGTQGQFVTQDASDKYGYGYNCSFYFDQILHPEEIVSVTLFDQTYQLK